MFLSIYVVYLYLSNKQCSSSNSKMSVITSPFIGNITLHFHHYGDVIMSVSNHQLHDCLLNRLFWCRSNETSKLSATGVCAGNSPVNGEFPTQWASNPDNFSIWWRHHVDKKPAKRKTSPCHALQEYICHLRCEVYDWLNCLLFQTIVAAIYWELLFLNTNVF